MHNTADGSLEGFSCHHSRSIGRWLKSEREELPGAVTFIISRAIHIYIRHSDASSAVRVANLAAMPCRTPGGTQTCAITIGPNGRVLLKTLRHVELLGGAVVGDYEGS
jgi:hypothetical protein